MTKYHSRAEIAQNTARMDADDKRRTKTGGYRRVFDPTPARDFAAQSLWMPETAKLSFSTASDLGVLALTIAGHVLSAFRKKADADPKAAREAMMQYFAGLPVPDARDLTRAVLDLAGLSPVWKEIVQNRPDAKGMTLNSQYFGAAPAAFQTGYDGHWLTREAALRLRLVRYYEKTSSEFAKLLARVMASLSRQGAAYAAWNAGWPIFVCDLNRTFERYAAQEIATAARGELAVVTKPLTNVTRTLLARHAPNLVVIEDAEGFLPTVLGNFSTVMLLERRIGGWTLTFPAGGVLERDLKNKRYPAFVRALARCAELPASFAAAKAKAKGSEA